LLAQTHTLIALDLPGHGGSDSVRADLTTTASLAADAVRLALEAGAGSGAACDVLGYSLGGRVALHLLLAGELPVRRAVLIGATAGLDDPLERERRRAADAALADRLESSDDLERFLEEWVRSPLFARLASTSATDLRERLRNSPNGLASSLRLCGTGTQMPLWNRLAGLACPVLALAGSDDIRFAASAVRLARAAPHAVASLVPSGGHAVHLSQPEQTWRIVDHWLGSGASELRTDAPPTEQRGSTS
jgi:2-succinyl-6-hydroxy-2,4-cyclohexadiene-1-carboxylate synthase